MRHHRRRRIRRLRRRLTGWRITRNACMASIERWVTYWTSAAINEEDGEALAEINERLADYSAEVALHAPVVGSKKKPSRQPRATRRAGQVNGRDASNV